MLKKYMQKSIKILVVFKLNNFNINFRDGQIWVIVAGNNTKLAKTKNLNTNVII